ncbi:MAG TPA: hypothetical protein VGJ15_12755 [Pirellulales bacterium]
MAIVLYSSESLYGISLRIAADKRLELNRRSWSIGSSGSVSQAGKCKRCATVCRRRQIFSFSIGKSCKRLRLGAAEQSQKILAARASVFYWNDTPLWRKTAPPVIQIATSAGRFALWPHMAGGDFAGRAADARVANL